MTAGTYFTAPDIACYVSPSNAYVCAVCYGNHTAGADPDGTWHTLPAHEIDPTYTCELCGVYLTTEGDA